ncbi:MAG: hypothetical protein Q8K63_08555, partial [Acidimicrobiales bacterium]|nr:hypothetical protein [Acidimicrobiales bacterium]
MMDLMSLLTAPGAIPGTPTLPGLAVGREDAGFDAVLDSVVAQIAALLVPVAPPTPTVTVPTGTPIVPVPLPPTGFAPADSCDPAPQAADHTNLVAPNASESARHALTRIATPPTFAAAPMLRAAAVPTLPPGLAPPELPVNPPNVDSEGVSVAPNVDAGSTEAAVVVTGPPERSRPTAPVESSGAVPTAPVESPGAAPTPAPAVSPNDLAPSKSPAKQENVVSEGVPVAPNAPAETPADVVLDEVAAHQVPVAPPAQADQSARRADGRVPDHVTLPPTARAMSLTTSAPVADAPPDE